MRRISPAVLGLLFLLGFAEAAAQETPLLSGGVAFVTNTTGGDTSYIPLIQPLAAVPLGDHLLVESRALVLEEFTPSPSGYQHSNFSALTYLQGDVMATRHLTVVVGSYLLPFGTYSERLTPVWIGNFQDEPLPEPIGQMATGVGLGGQLRGALPSGSHSSLSYAAWFSARCGNQNFSAQRSSGGRASIYFPAQRLEIGASYGRLLQQAQGNYEGMYLWWQTRDAGFRFRSEAMRGAHAYGYWFEADYRPFRDQSDAGFLRRFEPVFRMNQTFRINNLASDGVPAQNTQRADFGLDYDLPHNTRILTSYSRQFSPAGDVNIWQTGIVYRFLFPAWKGR